MPSLFISLLSILCALNCLSQTYNWGWSYGDDWGDNTWSAALSSDNQLIIISSGDTNNFDPAYTTYPELYTHDPVLSVRDSTGTVKNVFPLPVQLYHKRQMIIDNDDNLIIIGEFSNHSSNNEALVIGRDSINRYSDSSANCILKMDLDGNVLWFKTLDRHVRTLYTSPLATDHNGNIYLASRYSDSICYFNGEHLDTCYKNANLMASRNLFIQKLTPNGEHISLVSFENNHIIEPECLQVDVNGHMYLSGIYLGRIDFNPHPNLTLIDTSIYDSSSYSGYLTSPFLLKLNSDYSLAWAKTKFYASNFILDAYGNLVLTRPFSADRDIDPGPDSISFNTMDTTYDGGGTALVKMNGVTGAIDWMHGYSWLGEATDLHINSDKTITLAGDQIDHLKLTTSDGDIFIAHTPYNQANSVAKLIMNVDYGDGAINWAGLYADDVDTGMIYKNITVFGENGDIYVAGEFNYTIDLNPFTGEDLFTCDDIDVMPMGKRDNFIMKIKHHLLEPENDTVNTDISVYPNPTKGQISIDLKNLQNVEVDVYDIQGRLMYHDEGIFQNQYHFKLTANNGIYLVRVKAGHHIIAKKIIML